MHNDGWRLPDPPGTDVEAVRVVETGQRWNRLTGPREMVGWWIVDNPVLVAPPQVLDWSGLLVHGRHLMPTASLYTEVAARATSSVEPRDEHPEVDPHANS